MLITFDGRSSTDHKIAAIKAVRAYTATTGLKDAKEMVELAMEKGSASVVIVGTGSASLLKEALAYADGFDALSDIDALTDAIEQAIKMAVDLREYKTARALINTLPKDLRTEYLSKED